MDKVFDSVNGSTLYPKNGKELRCAIRSGSPHIQFWNEAIQVFESMHFKDKNGKRSIQYRSMYKKLDINSKVVKMFMV